MNHANKTEKHIPIIYHFFSVQLFDINLSKLLMSHPSKGCNRKLLLQLYKSHIRSKFDYAAPVYNLASKSVLSLLDPIQTSALRLATGFFRTSPRLSICAEAAEPPSPIADPFLHLISSLSGYDSIFSPPSPSPLPNTSVSNLKNSSTNHWVSTPSQQSTYLPLLGPSIRFDLTELETTNKSDYVQHIKHLLHEYPDCITCFTAQNQKIDHHTLTP